MQAMKNPLQRDTLYPGSVDAANPVYGSVDPLGDGGVIVVPFAEELLPTTGTVMLNFVHTSPNKVVKAALQSISLSSTIFRSDR